MATGSDGAGSSSRGLRRSDHNNNGWERDLPATETCKERHSKQKKKHKRKQNRSPGKLEGQGAGGKRCRVGGDLVGQEQAGGDCKRQGEDEGREQAEQFGVLPESPG